MFVKEHGELYFSIVHLTGELTQELPKTSVGKFDKKKLRATVLPEVLKKREQA